MACALSLSLSPSHFLIICSFYVPDSNEEIHRTMSRGANNKTIEMLQKQHVYGTLPDEKFFLELPPLLPSARFG